MSDMGRENSYYTIEGDFAYQWEGAGQDEQADIERALERTTKQLYALNARDVTTLLKLDTRSFWMSVLVSAPKDQDAPEVLEHGWSLIRSAFHAANVATPGW